MIVASFFAPRFDQWGCDYTDLLRWTQASCDAFGLRHVVISDRQIGRFECAIFPLPENLMLAILDGQRQLLEREDGPVLLIGADCLVCRDPRGECPADMAITIGPFSDCEMNTGAIWCGSGRRCAPIWAAALERMPTEWGQDQTALYAAVQANEFTGLLSVTRHRCETHNWAPDDLQDRAGPPVVAHFRGPRKAFMRQWAWLHLGINLPVAA